MITKEVIEYVTEYEIGDVFVRDSQNGLYNTKHGVYILTKIINNIYYLRHIASNTEHLIGKEWLDKRAFKYRYNYNRDLPKLS